MRRARFDRPGALALQPSAFGGLFDMFVGDEARAPFRDVDGVAVVDVSGPMTHHAEWWCDSYDSILERVAAACASSSASILLNINSPGGDVSGCYETARAIRAMASEAGKPLFAFVDGVAASGGYAIACAASMILATETGCVGSIGVMSTLVDLTAADRAYGMKFAIVTSGDRKADGNPHTSISESALAETQRHTDDLAAMFFAWVAESRGIDAGDVQAMQAGVFYGAKGAEAGLVDAIVANKEQALAMARGDGNDTTGPRAKQESSTMGWKADMQKAAEGGDEEAKKALAALEKSDGDGDEKKDAPKESDDAAPGSAESDDPPASDDEKKKKTDEDGAAAASASAAVLARLGKVEKELEAERKKNEASERSSLLASRADLTAGQRDYLASLSLPAMRAALAAFPPAPLDPAAADKVAPTLGADAGRAPRQAPAAASAMRQKMGLERPKVEIRRDRNDVVFPAMTPEQAKSALDARSEGGVK